RETLLYHDEDSNGARLAKQFCQPGQMDRAWRADYDHPKRSDLCETFPCHAGQAAQNRLGRPSKETQAGRQRDVKTSDREALVGFAGLSLMVLEIYPDSSFLFSLLAKDRHTPEASRY